MRDQQAEPAGRRRRVGLAALAAAILTALALGVAPVIGDGLNQAPAPADPVIAGTVVASVPQSRAASTAVAARLGARSTARRVPLLFTSRVTENPIVTEEGKGTFVGVACPTGYKAVSGGVTSSYINLLVSSSAPNNPLSGKFTPRIWWLTVTNANIDGQGGSLSWKGVVNCLSPIRLR
jgi:hypothetical protein